MGSLASIYIKKETLETLLKTVNQKTEKDKSGNDVPLKGIELTVSINDDSNQWGQNVSAYVSQTEEQRTAKKERFYVANGKVFWTDGTIKKGLKEEDKPATANAAPAGNPLNGDEDDLPF